MAVFSARAGGSPAAEQLPSWKFDPHRTEVSFLGRRMGAVWVNGHFKDVHGRFLWDLEEPLSSSCAGEIDVANLYAGEPCLNTQLRAADFLDASRHRTISFSARLLERTGVSEFTADVLLTLRGATRHVSMDLGYLGEWDAPVWIDGQVIGIATRMALTAGGVITRQEFEAGDGADARSGGDGTPANAIEIKLDVEAILERDLSEIGAVAL